MPSRQSLHPLSQKALTPIILQQKVSRTLSQEMQSWGSGNSAQDAMGGGGRSILPA